MDLTTIEKKNKIHKLNLSLERRVQERTAELFFFNDTATTEIYTLSLHDALPILLRPGPRPGRTAGGDLRCAGGRCSRAGRVRPRTDGLRPVGAQGRRGGDGRVVGGSR